MFFLFLSLEKGVLSDPDQLSPCFNIYTDVVGSEVPADDKLHARKAFETATPCYNSGLVDEGEQPWGTSFDQ